VTVAGEVLVNLMALSAVLGACGLPAAGWLRAIVDVESKGNPYAINVNGPMELARQPRTKEEAAAIARWLYAHGYSFDSGLGQVNSANLGRLGLDTVSVFDPCQNLKAAATVLDGCYERAAAKFGETEAAVDAALSCYNTGHFTKGVRNGYVAAVRGREVGVGALAVRTKGGRARVVAKVEGGASQKAAVAVADGSARRAPDVLGVMPDVFGAGGGR
jgi:type IV secretion system protein VirB1